jgi:Cof subfamily protein (haloacid dehalogenase superfamily)
MCRLLALDIDGTLLNDDRQVTEVTIAAIQRATAAGVYVTLCTGRSISTALHVARRLPLNAPLILNGGALIYDNHHRRALYIRNLLKSTALHAVYQLRSLGCYPLVYAPLPESQYFYYDAYDPHNVSFRQYIGKNVGRAHEVEDVTALIDQDAAMVAITDRVATIQDLAPSIRHQLQETTITLEVSPMDRAYCHVTVTPQNVSKGNGLRELSILLGVDLSETIAVGDNLNDLDMLSTAGLGVAMGNATPETKAQADYVTGSNNEDGVAQVVERFIL